MSLTKPGEKEPRLVLTLPRKVKHELKILAAIDNKPIGRIALSFIFDGLDKNRGKIIKTINKK